MTVLFPFEPGTVLSTDCPACEGGGCIDLEDDAWPCRQCDGTGKLQEWRDFNPLRRESSRCAVVDDRNPLPYPVLGDHRWSQDELRKS
jgi:hypothetical protein